MDASTLVFLLFLLPCALMALFALRGHGHGHGHGSGSRHGCGHGTHRRDEGAP